MSQDANNLTEFMSAEERRAYDKAKAKFHTATNDPFQILSLGTSDPTQRHIAVITIQTMHRWCLKRMLQEAEDKMISQ